MNRKTVVLCRISIIALAFALAAFRWPLNDGKITSTFGESRGDHLHDGTDMIGGSIALPLVRVGAGSKRL